MVYAVLGLYLEPDSSDFLFRRLSHGGVSFLEFDNVSEYMLPLSDSMTMVLFLANYFAGSYSSAMRVELE